MRTQERSERLGAARGRLSTAWERPRSVLERPRESVGAAFRAWGRSRTAWAHPGLGLGSGLVAPRNRLAPPGGLAAAWSAWETKRFLRNSKSSGSRKETSLKTPRNLATPASGSPTTKLSHRTLQDRPRTASERPTPPCPQTLPRRPWSPPRAPKIPAQDGACARVAGAYVNELGMHP